MFIDISPLKKSRDYRLLFIGQLVSSLGSFITYVALPYQIYEMTHSTIAVGIMGTVELIPLLLTAFIGGAFADSLNRRKLLFWCELFLMIGALLLAFNASLAEPRMWALYVLAAFMSALNGLHRPALGAIAPELIAKEDMTAFSALNSFIGVMGVIAGPAIGGFCLAKYGLVTTYTIDALTFTVSLIALLLMRYVPNAALSENKISLQGVKDGISFAFSRQELIGSYVIDFIAMVFSMPTALFPAIADHFDRPDLLGLLYSATAVGALIANLVSGWTGKVHRHGLAIALAASCWGLAIIAYGWAPNIWIALGCLVLAGVADMISGIFRTTLWNQTIPTHIRGRLASIEMISYTSGPLLGNTQSGFMAALLGLQNAIMMGGLLCVIGVGLCTWRLKQFREYKA